MATERVPGLLGARESHEPSLLLSNHMAGPLPPAPASWNGAGSIGPDDWGMDGNDQYGCCGAAATDHGNMLKASNSGYYNTLGQPTYAGTLPTYFAYGLAQGEPGPQPDQGVDNKTWLGFLYQHGIVDGYGEVPLDQLHSYAASCGGLILAIQCGSDFQDLFAQNPPAPWGSTGSSPDPNEGHDIYFMDYAEDGSAGIITWGKRQPVTESFFSTYVTDAWAFFDKDDPAVNWASLKAALAELHGTVRSA